MHIYIYREHADLARLITSFPPLTRVIITVRAPPRSKSCAHSLHTHTYIYIYICLHIHMHIHKYKYTYTCIHIYIYIYIIYMYIYIDTYVYK